MEIRGIGIIDVAALFGIRAIRLQKRIEVIVHLEYWDVNRQYGRTGLERDSTNILGVEVAATHSPAEPREEHHCRVGSDRDESLVALFGRGRSGGVRPTGPRGNDFCPRIP